MPADLSKKAMVYFIKDRLLNVANIRGNSQEKIDQRAAYANEIFTYILFYFNRFILNFKDEFNFLKTVRERCLYFINDESVVHYHKLQNTLLLLLEKLNEYLLNNDNGCKCCNCNARRLHIVKAEQEGLVG